MIRTVVVSCVICLGTRTLLVFPYTGKERKGKERKGRRKDISVGSTVLEQLVVSSNINMVPATRSWDI